MKTNAGILKAHTGIYKTISNMKKQVTSNKSFSNTTLIGRMGNEYNDEELMSEDNSGSIISIVDKIKLLELSIVELNEIHKQFPDVNIYSYAPYKHKFLISNFNSDSEEFVYDEAKQAVLELKKIKEENSFSKKDIEDMMDLLKKEDFEMNLKADKAANIFNRKYFSNLIEEPKYFVISINKTTGVIYADFFTIVNNISIFSTKIIDIGLVKNDLFEDIKTLRLFDFKESFIKNNIPSDFINRIELFIVEMLSDNDNNFSISKSILNDRINKLISLQ